MNVIKLAIVEFFLLALSAAAAIFLISAYTRMAFVDIPLLSTLTLTGAFYLARLAIMWAVIKEHRVRYKKLRGAGNIKVFEDKPKSGVLKKVFWLLIILVILFLLYQCVHQMGMENFELPINLGFR